MLSSSIPRFVDCLPPMPELPGVSAPTPSAFFHLAPSSAPSWPAFEVREEEIAIPSGMPPNTRHADLPTIPPPPQFWKLKRLDPSANVMDYWVKSTQQWDIEGIESDIAVSTDAPMEA